jgi:hypothetical protein
MYYWLGVQNNIPEIIKAKLNEKNKVKWMKDPKKWYINDIKKDH